MRGRTGYGLAVASLAAPLEAALREGDLPRRIKVLAWGDNPNANGRRVVVGRRLAEMLADPVYPFRRVALDFQHNTCPGTQAHSESGEPRPVAGYGRVEVVEGEGVFLCMDSWTPEGAAAAHHYACVSAVPHVDGRTGEVLAVSSVGLVRNGAVPGMDFVGAPLAALLPQGAGVPRGPGTEEGEGMDWRQVLVEALALDAGATDGEVEAALREPLGALVARAVGAAVAPLEARVAALAAGAEAREKAAAVAEARAQGKVVALGAGVLARMTPEELGEHLAALPVTVPLAARTPQAVPEGAGCGGPTEAQRAIAAACGVDADKVFGAPRA